MHRGVALIVAGGLLVGLPGGAAHAGGPAAAPDPAPDWEPAIVLDAAGAQDLDVATSPLGDAWAVWITADARAVLAHRTPTGTWSAPEQVTPTGLAVSDVDLAVGGDGTVAVLSAGASDTPRVQARVRRPGGALGAPVTLDDSALRAPVADAGTLAEVAALDVDAGVDGTLTAAWVTADGAVRATRLAAGAAGWTTPASVDDTGDAVRVDAVTTAPTTVGGSSAAAASLVVHTRDSPDPGGEDQVRATARRAGAWTPPQVLLDGLTDASPVAAAVGPDAVLAWLVGPGSPRVYAGDLTVADGGAVGLAGPPQPVSPADRAAAAPGLAVSATGPVLAWSQPPDEPDGPDHVAGHAGRPAGSAAWPPPATVPGLAGLRPGSAIRVTAADSGDLSVGGDLAGGGVATVLRRSGSWGAATGVDGPPAGVTRTAAAPDARVTLLTTVGGQALVQETPLPPPTPRTAPAVAGDPAIGSTLACDPGTWARAAGFTYAWRRGTGTGDVSVGVDYLVGVADVGAQLRCRVTATNAAGSTVATSDPASVPTAPAATAEPALSDPVRVGDPVACRAPEFVPAARVLRVQWLRDDAPLAGATGAAYTPRAVDLGRALRCRVDADGAGGSTSILSPARTVAKGAALATSSRPRVQGRPRVGADVTCAVGRWTPEATTVRVRWLVDGRALRRVTVPRLRVPAQARGDRLRCAVTAVRAGHPSGRAQSRPVRVR